MDTTMVIDERQLDALAARMSVLDEVLDDDEKVALLTVFALAGEALAARVEGALDVSGFAAFDAFNVGMQVSVPPTLPSLGAGVNDIAAKGKGKTKGETYLVVKLEECMISSY
jgi:hypothetical protein